MEITIIDFTENALIAFPLYFLISIPFILWIFSLRREVSRLNLYLVRDEWVYLAVSGVLQKNDETFKQFYELINTQIQHAEKLTLDKFYQVMLEANFVDSPSNRSNFEATKERIDKLPEEAKDVIGEFYGISLSVMAAHSNFLRVWLKVIEIDAIHKMVKLNLWILKRLKSYREYESIKDSRDKILNISDPIAA